jgi:hypothetical protein
LIYLSVALAFGMVGVAFAPVGFIIGLVTFPIVLVCCKESFRSFADNSADLRSGNLLTSYFSTFSHI